MPILVIVIIYKHHDVIYFVFNWLKLIRCHYSYVGKVVSSLSLRSCNSKRSVRIMVVDKIIRAVANLILNLTAVLDSTDRHPLIGSCNIHNNIKDIHSFDQDLH